MALIIVGTLVLAHTLASGEWEGDLASAVVTAEIAPAAHAEPGAQPHLSILFTRYAADEDSYSGGDEAGEDAPTGPVLVVEPLVPQPVLPPVPPSAPLPPHRLIVPVEGVSPGDLYDSFAQARGRERRHLAIDIGAPTGTPILAAVRGEVVRMHRSAKGGISLYIAGPDRRYVYYYAHLHGYAEGLREGDVVEQGQVVGYVGYTGNADPSVPHLHFAIWKRPNGSTWWGGAPVNPYLALVRQ